MSNGNSKLPPNSGMSDERWLGRNERQEQSGRTDISSAMRAILNHAEAADELIAELAEALRAAEHQHDDAHGFDACAGCFTEGLAIAALARVDALTKDTA